jgi:hypothetical protein
MAKLARAMTAKAKVVKMVRLARATTEKAKAVKMARLARATTAKEKVERYGYTEYDTLKFDRFVVLCLRAFLQKSNRFHRSFIPPILISFLP